MDGGGVDVVRRGWWRGGWWRGGCCEKRMVEGWMVHTVPSPRAQYHNQTFLHLQHLILLLEVTEANEDSVNVLHSSSLAALLPPSLLGVLLALNLVTYHL